VTEEPEKSLVHALVDTPFTQFFTDPTLTQTGSNPNSARGKKSADKHPATGKKEEKKQKNKEEGK